MEKDKKVASAEEKKVEGGHVSFKDMSKEERNKRLVMTILGVFFCGVSVGLYKLAAFGVDPFQVFVAGMDKLVPLEFGLVYVIINVVLILFSFFADRHYIGIATVINLFFLGYVAQYSLEFFGKLFPGIGIPGRIVCFVVAIVIMCFASAMYFTSDLGVSTYDAVSLIITNTWGIGKFQYVRIASDCTVVVLGIILYLVGGGEVSSILSVAGIGTIVTAFFMGPLIEVFNVHCARPFLYGKKEK